MKLKAYQQARIKAAKIKTELINEIISLLGGVSIPATATRQLTFIHTAGFAQIKSNWDAPSLMFERCDPEVNNLRLILEASGDVAATLSRIVQYKNVSNKYKGTVGYSFFRKVKPEHVEIIRNYLGDNFIETDKNGEKRNLSPARRNRSPDLKDW